MQITLKLFAFQAQVAGRQVTLDLPTNATAADALAALKQKHPALPWAPGTLLAINMEFAPPDTILKPNDVLAIIPPVSGG